jgi:glucokinase
MPPAIGIDIGGSKIAVGVVDGTEIVYYERHAYAFGPGAPGLPGFLAGAINSLSTDFAAEYAGIGSPGWVVDGVVREAVNIGIAEMDMREAVQALARVPVFVENDARTALLGEFSSGALSGCRNAMMLTLGTGIGGAFLLEGRLYRGSFGCAGEIGHVSVNPRGRRCSCGKRGCLELMSSASALVRGAKRSARKRDGMLHALCRGDIDAIDGQTVFSAAEANDADALALLRRYVDGLSHALLETAYLLDLDAIAIGGGISAQDRHLIEPLRRRFAGAGSKCDIRQAALGNNAGIIGAAMLGRLG